MYTIVSVDGQQEAEKLLNDTVGPGVELVHSHIETARQEPDGAQENVMLGVPVIRFTFIFRHRSG
jgi:hypothetical protein